MQQERVIWKIRTIKDYPEAHNHLIVGEVIGQSGAAIRVKGRTFHFGNTVGTLKDVKVGPMMVRLIPWGRVEIIHELVQSFDYGNAQLVLAEDGGGVTLTDNANVCRIFTAYHRPY